MLPFFVLQQAPALPSQPEAHSLLSLIVCNSFAIPTVAINKNAPKIKNFS